MFGLVVVAATLVQETIEGAVVPPPWADPNLNPCAAEPGGWQLLYWPSDSKCYKIFQKGYPCPDTMELTPGVDRIAECRCPPGTAQSSRDALCHTLYQRGPCRENEYFSPVTENNPKKSSHKQRWGACVQIEKCANENEVFWPNDRLCYKSYSRGPCPEGQLLSPLNNKLGDCHCERSSRMAKFFWESGGTCHEPYTSGPCQERGTLFLPGGKCGCHPGLEQFHPDTAMCYQLGTVGPCLPGHQFVKTNQNEVENNSTSLGEPIYAKCVCKEGHVRWTGDGICYRPYTRGPCQHGFMFAANKTEDGNSDYAVGCIPVPCPTGRLYFPGRGCYRVGTQGPCPLGQVVLFQESVRTSVEGISFKGMCGCPNHSNNHHQLTSPFGLTSTRCESLSRKEDHNFSLFTDEEDSICTKRGTILWKDETCVQLYIQGPCNDGEWVVPDRGKGQRKGRGSGWKMGKCECRPGYSVVSLLDSDSEKNLTVCQPPVVSIAQFLNSNNVNNYNRKEELLDNDPLAVALDDNFNA